MPSLARGVAVIVAGTLAEFVIRRAIKMVFRPRSLLPALKRDSTVVQQPGENGMEPDAVIESEAFTVRRVRVRRGRDA